MLVAVFTAFDSLDQVPWSLGSAVDIIRADYELNLDISKRPVPPFKVTLTKCSCVVGRSGTSLVYMEHDKASNKDIEHVVSIRYEVGRPKLSQWQSVDGRLTLAGSIHVLTEDSPKAEAQARRWIEDAQRELMDLMEDFRLVKQSG
jgi:hypothetical protein